MRRLLIVLCLVPATLVARDRGMSVNFDGGDLTDCSQMHVTLDDGPVVTAQEVVDVGNVRSLAIRAARNGGIHVTGSESGRYEVTACKAAALESTLSDIHVRFNGNEITAEGPDHDRWVLYFLVRAPRGASLDLNAVNGPIALRNVNGTIAASAVNGPVSIRESSGTMDIDTTNGPISVDGGSGTAKLNATNGPITVRLRGTTWDGTLDARTQNGPVSLRIPAAFRSGVVVESEGRGPVSCRAEACRNAKRSFDDDDNRRIELGYGSPAVHLSTSNGPVSVKESEQ